jgi:methylthioribose-1-phosphate isomerase
MGKMSNMSILAREHGVSFYLAAPSRTFEEVNRYLSSGGWLME